MNFGPARPAGRAAEPGLPVPASSEQSNKRGGGRLFLGRGRALEMLLGGNDLSAELAERYGHINRALPTDELTPFVEKLAHRIASREHLVPWRRGSPELREPDSPLASY
jgi:hypothetical protein